MLKSEFLEAAATRMKERIVDGKIGAFETVDEDYDGFYLVQWIGQPFELEETTCLEGFDNEWAAAGSVVCRARFLEHVGGSGNWWYFPEVDLPVVVPVSKTLSADVLLEEVANKPSAVYRHMSAHPRLPAPRRISEGEAQKIKDWAICIHEVADQGGANRTELIELPESSEDEAAAEVEEERENWWNSDDENDGEDESEVEVDEPQSSDDEE